MKVWGLIERAIRDHGGCAMVSVVDVQGSAPREAWARMVVTPQGFHGTIGGGTLEWRALAVAQGLLGKPRAVKMIDQALGPDLGQCCGGRVKLAVECFDLADLSSIADFAARESLGRFDVQGRIPGLDVTESFGDAHRSVLVFGAGHVGRALILALAPLPFAVTWADPRPDAFPGAAPANATLISGDPLDVIAAAPQDSLVMIMSHSHALDLALADAALRNPAIAHVGVIGSATKRARFEKRLREAGVPDAKVEAMICPIGIGSLRSKLPAAIALTVATQLMALDEALAAAVHIPQPVRRTAG